jgi:tetratricopeptide (TPR) repeat protein/predicted O-methyltransferase YrrM
MSQQQILRFSNPESLILANSMTLLLHEAIAACEQAVQSKHSLIPACQTLGNLLQGLGRFEEALYWHTCAIQPQIDRASMLAALAKLQAQQQQWPAAIATYESVLDIEPNSPGVHWSLSNIYTQLQKPLEAVQHRWQAFYLCPEWRTSSNQFELANQLFQQHQLSLALACYQHAIQLRPDFFEAYYNLATVQVALGNLTAAIEAYRQVVQLQPTYISAHRKLAQLLEHQGNWPAALDHYQQGLRQVDSDSPQSGGFYYEIGNLYFRQGRYAEAAAMFRAAVQADRELTWAYHQWIDALLQQQQGQAAIQVCQMALAAGQDQAWVYTFWGRALSLSGEIAEATTWFQKGCAARNWPECIQRNYQFTQDWFSHNIPIWQTFLAVIAHQPNLHGLEIGSYQGMSACWLLDHVLTHPTASLTCIDPDFQTLFRSNLSKTGAAQRVKVQVGHSHDLLPALTPHSFDMIYVDGCHLADHVYRDAELAWPLLKLGGLMIFDDYEWQDPNLPGQDPKQGIDAFLAGMSDQIQVLHRSYQLIIRKE